MAATAMATGRAPKLSHASTNHRRLDTSKKLNFSSLKFLMQNPNHPSASSVERSFTIQSSNNNTQMEEEKESSIDGNAGPASSFQDDLSFLWKLGIGSFVGAAVIKYGSILFPDITRPNIVLALVLISTPVVVAVWLLVRQSRVEQQN